MMEKSEQINLHSPVEDAKTILTHPDQAATVPERVRYVAQHFPNHIAINTPERSITYQVLLQAMQAVADTISMIACNPAHPILLVPGLDDFFLIKSVLGILDAGYSYVYLNESYPQKRIKEIIEDIEPEWLVSDTKQYSRAIDMAKAAENPPQVLNLEPPSETVFSGQSNPFPPSQLLSVQYTSGTTGRPKGIKITHERFLNAAKTSVITPDDRVAILINFNLSGIFIPLMRGAQVCPYNPNRTQPSELLQWLKQSRISIIAPPVALFRRILEVLPEPNYLPNIRQIFLHGEAVLASDIRLFRQKFNSATEIYTLYSSTETFGITRFRIRPRYKKDNQPVPAGFPVKNKEIRIVDEQGNQLPRGRLGEVVVMSRFLSPGYWKKTQLTAKRFVNLPNGNGKRAYFTGDLGKIDRRGCLHLRGRKDRQVKIRGYRIEIESIEQALRELQEIKDVAVIANDWGDNNKRLIAFLVLNQSQDLSIRQIREKLKLRLPSYMIPSSWLFLSSLPLLPNMKVDYQQLPNPQMQRERLEGPMVLPRTTMEARLLQHWQAIFKQQLIGIKDNFYDLGGDSLLAVALISRIEKDLQQSLPIAAIRHINNIELQARQIIQHKSDKAVDESSLSRNEFSRLSSAISTSQMEPVNPQGLIRVSHPQATNPPLFWCFNAPSVEPRSLSEGLGTEQPLYVLFSGIFAIKPLTDKTVKRIARHYLQELLAIDPNGPYRLGGNCSGAQVAVEMAIELRKKGKVVEKLICMEAFDQRLLDFSGEILLLYGKESHLRAHQQFDWGKPGWEKPFTQIPQVEWLPGPHGQFFTPHHIPALAGAIGDFLEK